MTPPDYQARFPKKVLHQVTYANLATAGGGSSLVDDMLAGRLGGRNPPLQVCGACVRLHSRFMWKKVLPLLLVPCLLAGCSSTFTNLTAQRQPRNPNHLYPVGVAFNTRQQSLRWDSIQPVVVVGTESFPLRQTVLMSNRWEGLVPVPAGTNLVHYHYKFDFQYNDFGGPKSDSAFSPPYRLQILE